MTFNCFQKRSDLIFVQRLYFFLCYFGKYAGICRIESDIPIGHGLRHTYAAEKYRQLIADGISELDAHLTVSRLLGHERADVTNIYLSSIEE